MSEKRSSSINIIKSILKDKNWEFIEPESLLELNLDIIPDLKKLISVDFIFVRKFELNERFECLILVPIKISDHKGFFRFNTEKIRYVNTKQEKEMVNQKIREKIIDKFIKPLNEAGDFIRDSFDKFSPLAGIIFDYLKLDVDIHFDPKNGHFYTVEGKKLMISVKKLILTKNRTEFRLLNEFKQTKKNNPYLEEIENIINNSPFGFFQRLGIFFAIYPKLDEFLEYIEEREALIGKLKDHMKKSEISGDYSILNILLGLTMFVMGFIDLGIFFKIPNVSLSEIFFYDSIIILIAVIIYFFYYFKAKKNFKLKNNFNKIKIMGPLGLIPEIFFKEFQTFNQDFEFTLHKFQFITEHMIFWTSNYQEKTINSKLKHCKILIEEFNNNRNHFEERRNEKTRNVIEEIETNFSEKDQSIDHSTNLKGLFKRLINKKVSLNEIESINFSILNKKTAEAFKDNKYNTTSELIMLNLMIIFNTVLCEKKILPLEIIISNPQISDILKEISNKNIYKVNYNLIRQTELWENSILDDNKSVNLEYLANILKLYKKIKHLIKLINITGLAILESKEQNKKSNTEELKINKKIYSFNDPKFLSDFLNGNI